MLFGFLACLAGRSVGFEMLPIYCCSFYNSKKNVTISNKNTSFIIYVFIQCSRFSWEERERVCCFLGKYFPSIWLGWVGGSVARCISYRFGMSFSLHYLCRLLFIVVVFLIVFCFSYYYHHFLCKTELELPTTQRNGFVYSRVIALLLLLLLLSS